ncbi:MAG: helix-turn-helix domain-containing protein [Gallionella sp.]
MTIKSYRALVRASKETDSFWIEHAKHDFAFGLNQQLKRSGMVNTSLAKKLGVKPPYISKVMRGDENLTIGTMVKLVRAAGGKLHLQVSDQQDGMHWFQVVSGKRNSFASDAATFQQAQAAVTETDTYQEQEENAAVSNFY